MREAFSVLPVENARLAGDTGQQDQVLSRNLSQRPLEATSAGLGETPGHVTHVGGAWTGQVASDP